MRRLARRLFSLCSATSLVLCVGVLASWVVSLSHRHSARVSGWRHYGLVADSGLVEARYGARTDVFPGDDGGGPVIRDVAFEPGGARPVVRWGAAGPPVELSPTRCFQSATWTAGGEVPFVERHADGTPAVRYRPFGVRVSVVAVPHWLVAAVVGSPAGLWFLRARRRGRRAGRGHCLRCGYDLRASPGRCPECGAAAEGQGSTASPY